MPAASPVALITGASRRIGAGIARHLHAHGYLLALHYLHSHAHIKTLANELNAIHPGSVYAFTADLRAPECLPELIGQVVAQFGRLDALINNASLFYPTPLDETTPAQWDELFACNARAPFFLAKAAAPHLKASSGAIVNITDIYAHTPLRGHPIYSMSKAALMMATHSLALELAPKVRVNAIAPGAILWPEYGHDPERERRLIASTPLARTGRVEEIADAVHWLLTSAHYTTGQVLRVDGGRSLVE